MKTPIYDFVKAYSEKNTSRLHMPGHKGKSFLGCEKYDITEIDGADVLYSARGIINESEENATSLFSTLHSFYSTEGSTLCIKAMLTLICKHTKGRPLILAARNAHKAFIYAAALLDFDAEWIYPDENEHFCKCTVTKKQLEKHILSSKRKPDAVYITSPDYLGNISDIKGIASVCDKYGIPLLVDNAHGAYLNFLPENLHPIKLGATMCCDSAHKTLPVLTAGAYLHLSQKAEKYLSDARDALSVHASTSPSYLILQSLDICNKHLAKSYKEKLLCCINAVCKLKDALDKSDFSASLNEPLKLTLQPLCFGYTGNQLAEMLAENGIFCEFYDRDVTVLMFTPENTEADFTALYSFFSKLEKKEPLSPSLFLKTVRAKTAVTIRQAMLSPSEYIQVEESVGRICAEPSVSCPPAIPICISGEIITEETVKNFIASGTKKIKVMK